MTLTTSDPPRAPLWPAILVALAGAAVGWHFGSAAMFMYGGYAPADDGASMGYLLYVGPALGAVSGAGVGVAWWLLMRGLVGRASGLKVIAAGAGLGVAAGIVSTLVLHAGLAAVFGRWGGADRLGRVGLCVFMFGVPAGLVTGLVCGLVVWAAVAIARRVRASAAAPPRNP